MADAPEPQLPVDPGMTSGNQRLTALRLGQEAGWFVHRFTRGVGEGYRGGDARYAVELPDGRQLLLGPGEVLPWVLGVACAHGQPERVAYRWDLMAGGGPA